VGGEGRQFLPETHLPDGSFAALGVGPQVILVVPQKNVVFVHRTDTNPEDAKLIPMGKVGELIERVFAAAPAGGGKKAR
jgi:CubicO group peptidase (beta-lactamase class C family)